MKTKAAGKKRKDFIKTSEIRESFLGFFEKTGHRRIPSSPVIPFGDPTLLFTNAGMNQFKDVFTGRQKAEYKRATSSQKCIRAGGKHNDLDNVGFTARHHTFFEMLGNFSFGDYFKEEAIAFAWEWVTKEIKLSPDKLYATVYEDDDEAFAFWEKVAPELKKGKRILRFGKKDNYWSMGDVGPCGPCSEIHYDRGEKFGTGPNDVINGETDRFVEIWNLVFMQFDQLPDGQLVNLPKPSVDTGAGLERLAAVVQNVDSNYQIDIFKNIIKAIVDIAKSDYKKNPSSHHVIADHLRALTFAIADGAGISNEGQGYVLRRILRRAARHGRNLGMNEPFIFKLVPVLVNEMGGVYPEIAEKQKHIENVIRTEEEAFGRTLATGLEHIDAIVKKLKDTKTRVIPGDEVFRLYDTYGFPYDLTEIIAAEHGFALDRDGFDKSMQKQQEQSKASGRISHGLSLVKGGSIRELDTFRNSEFVRTLEPISTKIWYVYKPNDIFEKFDTVHPSRLVLLERTPFYAESGGQISDTGKITSGAFDLSVTDVLEVKGQRLHLVNVTRGSIDEVREGIKVIAEVDSERRWDIMRNHTATHLAHAALRKVLGTHVKQSGSYVGPDRLRFDFSHHQPMTPEEIDRVENIVNEEIIKGTVVTTDIMPVEQAKKSGAMALFGEKYGDKVRVVSVDDYSKELCGGTHVDNVGQIGPFIITVETGVASGVRRLEAVTGREAIKLMLSDKKSTREISAIVGRPLDELVKGVEHLKENVSALQKELKKVKSQAFTGGGKIGDESKIDGVNFITHNFGETDRDIMSGWIDRHKEDNTPVVALGLGQVNGKLTYMASVSSAASKQFQIDIGKVSKELLPRFGGQGGGKSNFAQGSVAADTDISLFFDAAKEIIFKHKGSQ